MPYDRARLFAIKNVSKGTNVVNKLSSMTLDDERRVIKQFTECNQRTGIYLVLF